MLKVNTDPDCPGADIRKGDSLTSWDTIHQDRGKHSMASIPKDRWQEIFGPKSVIAFSTEDSAAETIWALEAATTLTLDPGEIWTPETMRKAMKAKCP
jgi:hypothetical protein